MKVPSVFSRLTSQDIQDIADYQRQSFLDNMANIGLFRVSPQNDPSVVRATFTNPSIHKIWRHGVSTSGTLTVPYQYSYPVWEILKHDDQTVVASGLGTTVTWTPSFLGTDKCNLYTIRIHATRVGHPDLWQVWPGEITVYPATFTEGQADLVVDISSGSFSNINGGDIDRAATGYKIYVKGIRSGTNAWNAFGWISTNPLKPVVFQFNDVSLTCSNGSVQACKWGPNNGVIIDGCPSESVDYGLRITRSGGSTENFYYILSGGKRAMIAGVKVDNGSYTTGGSGFVVQVTQVADTEWLHVTRNRILNANNEAIYITTVNETAGTQYARIFNAYIYNNYIDSCRNEAIQTGGLVNFEVFRNQLYNTGKGAEAGQMNAYVLRESCDNGAFYMNDCLSEQDIVQLFPGIYGGSFQMFSNLFRTTGGTGLQNCLARLSQNLDYATLNFITWNNTYIAKNNNNEQYSLYNWAGVTPSTIMKFYADLCAFVSTVTTGAVSHNSFSLSNTIVNNKAYLTSGIATAKFKDPTNNDYHILDLTSPLLSSTRNATIDAARTHWLKDYDLEGVKYNPSNLASCCYSGMELMV